MLFDYIIFGSVRFGGVKTTKKNHAHAHAHTHSVSQLQHIVLCGAQRLGLLFQWNIVTYVFSRIHFVRDSSNFGAIVTLFRISALRWEKKCSFKSVKMHRMDHASKIPTENVKFYGVTKRIRQNFNWNLSSMRAGAKKVWAHCRNKTLPCKQSSD